ncbi:TIGR00282 family metallophosphoesterase [Peptococcaceae bacterium]|nr:TIGR00282 family metallophosphoesterase [Peptococcaceae bacterium]
MRILMIADIVGNVGLRAVKECLQGIKEELKIDFVIANAENVSDGKGIAKSAAKELFSCGIDVLTTGNHVWDKKEIFDYISNENRIIRPANYPPEVPGKGYVVCELGNNIKLAVINLMGRVFMAEIDCPFRKADEILREIGDKTDIILVDFHAEATSEKMAMGWYLDGRVTALFGTHTHVQTADERILPKGTAYITDIGMTGPRDSVIGIEVDIILRKFITALPQKFKVACTPYQFNAVFIDVDEFSGKVLEITRIFDME